MSEESKIESKQRVGRTGLVNLGNTCFLNAALQMLRQVPALKAYFQKPDWMHRINQSSKYAPMVIPNSDFINAIWRSDLEKGTRISPGRFYHTLTEIANKVGYDDLAVKFRQADAGEALNFMIDCLHEGLAHPVEMAITGNPTTADEKRLFNSYEHWIRHYKKQWSSLVRSLHGQKMSATTCKACQYHSETFETWASLNIPIVNANIQGAPAPTLAECLKEYFKDETIDDYHCDACGKKQEANHTIRLSILPENIVLILNRFTNHGAKVRAKIAFDLDLIDLDQWFIGNKETTGTKYRAISVIDHRGIMQGGHYVASSRDATDPSVWLRFDDDSVDEIPAENVNNSDTYVILLEQITKREDIAALKLQHK